MNRELRELGAAPRQQQRRAAPQQQQQPRQPPSFDLGLAAQQRGDNQAAVRHFETAARESPLWPYSHYYLANTQLGLGLVENAVKSYQSFIEMEPRVVEARVNLGIMKFVYNRAHVA